MIDCFCESEGERRKEKGEGIKAKGKGRMMRGSSTGMIEYFRVHQDAR